MTIQALLDYITLHGGGYVVIVDDINRFARDVVAHFTLKEAIKQSSSELEPPSQLRNYLINYGYFQALYAAGTLRAHFASGSCALDFAGMAYKISTCLFSNIHYSTQNVPHFCRYEDLKT